MSENPLPTQGYDYELPESAIAQTPLSERGSARLLCLSRREDLLRDAFIGILPDLLAAGDLLVTNDTRVVPARLLGLRERTGGRAEVLVLEQRGAELEVLLKTRGSPEVGEALSFTVPELAILVGRPLGDGRFQATPAGDPIRFADALRRHGRVPLPPYIRRDEGADPRDLSDRDRYQTVFAANEGAVAAPTAGLHFDHALLDRLAAKGVKRTNVTLHVGLGTFRPIQVEDVREHVMHEESFVFSEEAAESVRACRARGGRIVAVGTTSVRVLESAATSHGLPIATSGKTRLFIHEPYNFRFVDALLTNFHAPRSTLLLLVSAFAGKTKILKAYHHALRSQYRFLSYGDAMLIT